jgi:hypothetical protein
MNKFIIISLMVGIIILFYCYQNDIIKIQFVLPTKKKQSYDESDSETIEVTENMDDVSISDLKSIDSVLD